jgi:hypothetical protein
MYRQPKADRLETITRQFKSGLVLEDIGREHGLTRERVRQILAAAGVKPQQGGRHIRKACNVQARIDAAAVRRNLRITKRYGCTAEQYDTIMRGQTFCDDSMAGRYLRQRCNAAKNGIEFLLTLPQWHSAWVKSGKTNKIGLRRGMYVLSRKDKSGPYSIDNIAIRPSTENIREFWAENRNKPGGLRNNNTSGYKG